MAAPVGNKYGTRARVWSQAIERALAKRSRADQIESLDVLAEKLLALCDQGDLQALKELGDRMEGKPAVSIEAQADVRMEISWDDSGTDSVPSAPTSD